jgi:hypothetical protein
MAKAILRKEDFKSSSGPQQVQGFFYRGEGFPNGRVLCLTKGGLYLDNSSGQLWICKEANSASLTAWLPFSSYYINTAAQLDTDVQHGDLVGIFGVGAWASSGAMINPRTDGLQAGSQTAAFVSGGYINGAFNAVTSTEIFNGSSWQAANGMPTKLGNGARAGSVNAGLVSTGGNGSTYVSNTYLFDGSSWATGAVATQAKERTAGDGTQSAAWMTAGGNTAAVSRTEYFNGSAWHALSANTLVTRHTQGFGAQNAATIAGGLNTPYFNLTEFFNGTSWAFGPTLSQTRTYVGTAGTQLSGFISNGTRASAQRLSSTETFNGSVWAFSGNTTQPKEKTASGAGTAFAGLVCGGITSSVSNRTELHSQSIYRKLTYSNMASAVNIGMAINYSATSLTASVICGDLPSTIVPSNSFFGISRFSADQNIVKLSSITGTVSSITVTDTGLATLNLSATLTESFWPGMGLLVNGNIYPVVGGTAGAPVVRWNTSSSASTSLTFAPVFAHRFANVTVQSFSLSGSLLTINLAPIGNISSDTTTKTFERWCSVGNTIHIPANITSSALGSAYNYGAYEIVSVTNGYSVSVTANNSTCRSEVVSISNVTIYQQFTVNNNCLADIDIQLGFRNKMHVPYLAFYDDFSNGIA